MRFIHFLAATLCLLLCQIPIALAKVQIVAAENFYGEVAKEIGGDQVTVTSILQNPEQDPHLFTASPSVAKSIAKADIVVYNGADYDEWMTHLLSASNKKNPPATIIIVAELVGTKKGDNPHIWYIPSTMSYYADALYKALIAQDPSHKDDYTQHLQQFQLKQTELQNTVAALRKKTNGLAVTATEPVFNWMADALGLQMRNLDFQWSMENEGSPAPSAVKAMLDDLKNHKVHALFYNAQVTSPLTTQIKTEAEANHIPVIGITETLPNNLTYHQWMHQQLQALERALP